MTPVMDKIVAIVNTLFIFHRTGFLLVFTIMYAILDKTKVLGTEGDGPRKNLNAMASFVIAFLVIASTTLVSAISTFVSTIVLLVVLSVMFLLLVGSFTDPKEMKEGIFLPKEWRYGAMVVAFIGIILVFLYSMPGSGNYCSGDCNWLTIVFNFISQNGDSSALGALLLLAAMVLFVWWMGKSPKEKNNEDK